MTAAHDGRAGRAGRAGRSGRELGVACLLTLAGAVVVLLATRQQWVAPHHGAVAAPATGSELVPVAHALALVALAGVVALLAARRWSRVGVGAALALAGLAIVAAAASQLGRTPAGWPVLTIAGGLLVLCAGALTVLRSRGWPALGARYDAPAGRRTDDDVWAALDRGEDPTAG